jgi:hypothetical protein
LISYHIKLQTWFSGLWIFRLQWKTRTLLQMLCSCLFHLLCMSQVPLSLPIWELLKHAFLCCLVYLPRDQDNSELTLLLSRINICHFLWEIYPGSLLWSSSYMYSWLWICSCTLQWDWLHGPVICVVTWGHLLRRHMNLA